MRIHYFLVGFAAFLILPLSYVVLSSEHSAELPPKTIETPTGGPKSNLKTTLLSAESLDRSQLQREFFEFDRESALKDPYERVSDEFKISKLLYRRVKFWFDIYTKHDSKTHVIHHTKYPWVIYEVIETHDFFNTRGPLWLKRQRAERFVQKRKKMYRQALNRLAKRRNGKARTKTEKYLAKALGQIRLPKKKLYQEASKNIRVQLGQRNHFLSGLKNSQKYLGIFEREFHKKGLPKELTRLPFVESSFNEKAQSKVGATGVWQIMPNIGKRMSIVGKYIDERNSPVKGAQVAAKILYQNYRMLKSWPLAVTAYNNGAGNLRKAIRRARSKNLARIIERNYKGAFKFASSNFYASYLAALYAENYHREIFKDTILTKQPKLVKLALKLNKPLRPKQIAKFAGISLKELLSFNLDLRSAISKNTRLPRGYRVYLDPDSHNRLSKRL